MEDIILSIDGQNVRCAPGTSILDAAEGIGIKIPKLCHHPSLQPFGACRLCLVEDEKTGRLAASCVTPAVADMVIRTSSPRIQKHRRNIVRLMIAEHPESCLVCSKGNRCELRQIAAQLGIGETNLYPMPNYRNLEQANPFIVRDLSKCVLCGKCIRADHELVVVGAIDYSLRGFQSRPVTAHDVSLEESTCTFCGTCVSMCPTGALSTKNARHIGTPERERSAICGFCGVGCRLTFGVAHGKIVDVNPSRNRDSVNGPTLCVRGHFAHDFLNAEDRLASPLMRREDEEGEDSLLPIPWDQALDLVAKRLTDIKHEYGPQSIAFLGSSKCTNEENYLFQKIARVQVGTNNVDNGGYISGQYLLARIDERTGGACRVRALRDIEKAEAIVVLGADPSHSTPVLSYHIKRASEKGVPLIVADPRHTELSRIASLRLALRPRSDLELINALCFLLYENQWYDRSFVDQYTQGFSVFRLGLSSFDLDRAGRLTGLGVDSLKAAARCIKDRRICFVIGSGILQQQNGTYTIDAILNLALLTGSVGDSGPGLYVLAGENNQVGAMDMGTRPDALPGRAPLRDDGLRREWERIWQTKISPDPGINMCRMVEEAEKGNLKALYIMGENPLRSLPQQERVENALRRLDFLVVQDVVKTKTAGLADVVFPGACFSEKDGSYTNLEGRIQTGTAVVSPPGDARPDWEILALLAARMGSSDAHSGLDEIRGEIRRRVPMYGDLGTKEESWIASSGDETLSQEKGPGRPMPFTPVVSSGEDLPDEAYPFTAILGPLRYHLGSGTRTGRSERIQGFGQKGEAEICPEDADQLGIRNGDGVRAVSRHGEIERGVRLARTVGKGQLFVPLGFNGNDAMNLIGLADLTRPDAQGWKTCQVKLIKAEG